MISSRPTLAGEAIRFMESGEAPRVALLGRKMVAAFWDTKGQEPLAGNLREAYLELLRRRGYFVSTPRELLESLGQIQSLGPGFDLYDVAQQLAALDTIAAECLKQISQRRFPELTSFAPRCPCGKHPSGLGRRHR
jgi:hypothetical protein